jgi:hypothetical protein
LDFDDIKKSQTDYICPLLGLLPPLCRHVFATMSFIAETLIFLYVGMDALDIEMWRMTKLRWYFSSTTVQLCHISITN